MDHRDDRSHLRRRSLLRQAATEAGELALRHCSREWPHRGTEIDVAPKIAGRTKDILVDEGDSLSAGQVLAQMETEQHDAQKREAEAQVQRAIIAVATAGSLVTQREAESAGALAALAQRAADLDAAQRRFACSEALAPRGAVTEQTLDDDRARFNSAKAAVDTAQAQLAAADAAIGQAKSQVVDAKAAIDGARATIKPIQRARRSAQAVTRREKLYGEFIDETSKLVTDALTQKLDDASKLVPLYTLVSNLRLIAPAAVISTADEVTSRVFETYESSEKEFRAAIRKQESRDLDVLWPFSEACRRDMDL